MCKYHVSVLWISYMKQASKIMILPKNLLKCYDGVIILPEKSILGEAPQAHSESQY